MSRPNFRPRPIDVFRKLPVVRSAKDLDDDDTSQLAKELAGAADPLDEDEKEELLLNEALAAVNEIKPANIPVPRVEDVELYDADNPHKCDRPQNYIRFQEKTPDEQDATVMYEIDTEDEEFVKTFGGEKKGLPEAKFEAIVDRLEKEAFKAQGQIPQVSCLDGKVQGRHNVFSAVYEYWTKKRTKRGRALIRKFQAPTSINDPSPHATFRPREREQKHYRRTRKNDKDAYNKLTALRLDFDRARTLLSLILNRERLKKDLAELTLNLQMSQVMKEKDPLAALTILREQDAKLKRRQALVLETKKGAKIKPKKERVSQQETHLPSEPSSEDDYEEEEEEDEEESLMPMSHALQLQQRFRRLMCEWDGEQEFCRGSSLLPITMVSDDEMDHAAMVGQPGADAPLPPGR